MATNAVGDVKEKAMHQPLLSPDEPLEVVVLQSGQVCLVNTELPCEWYCDKPLLVTVPLHEQNRHDFIYMDDNAPAH